MAPDAPAPAARSALPTPSTRPSPRPGGETGPALAFAGCALIWGSTFLVIRIGNDTLAPLWAASLRLLIAATLMTIALVVMRLRFPTPPELAWAALFGFLTFGLNMGLLYWGEKTVPSGLTAVFYATGPLTTALFVRMLGLERLQPAKLVAAAVSLAGVVIIFAREQVGAVTAVPLGAVFLAATIGSLAGVVLKRGPRQHPLVVNAVAAWAGLPVCLTASALLGERHPWPRTSAELVPVLYLAVVGSIGAYGLYAYLVNRWPVTRVSFVTVVVPVVALALGAAVRHERLTAGGILGSVLVLVGLGLAMSADTRKSSKPA